MMVTSRVAAFALALCVCAPPLDLIAQGRAGAGQPRGGAQPRGGVVQGGRQGGGRATLPPGGLTPRDIQAHFDAYLIMEGERMLRISEEQYPQFVQRVRTLQRIRRESRMQRTRALAQLNQLLRVTDSIDEAKLASATKALDDQERNSFAEAQKAVAAIDEVLTPWQRARFRVLEDQLEQKKLDLLFRARQGSRR